MAYKNMKTTNLARRFCYRFDDFQVNGYLVPAASAVTFDKMNEDIKGLPADEREEALEAFFGMFAQYEISDICKWSFGDPQENM